MAKEDRLLPQLNASKTAASDHALWQVIKQLIDRIKQLESLLGGTSTSTITNIQQIIQQMSSDDGGGSGDDGPPGVPGIAGATGATGAMGPPFPAFAYLEGNDGEEQLPIPGPVGPTGNTGATGATGPPSFFIQYEDGIPGEDGCPIPSITPSTVGWNLIATRACSGLANEDFTGLSGYTGLVVLTVGITKSVSGITQLQVSTDNGSTWLTSSGDYQVLAAAGTLTNDDAMDFHATASTAARSGRILIWGFNSVGQRVAITSASVLNYIIPGTTALNAIRVLPSGGGNLNAGTIYVFGI